MWVNERHETENVNNFKMGNPKITKLIVMLAE